MYAVVMASRWRQALWLLEQIAILQEQGVHKVASGGERGQADPRAADAMP
jgi:hypothetical protein